MIDFFEELYLREVLNILTDMNVKNEIFSNSELSIIHISNFLRSINELSVF